jgi:GT2 family glycosyltransferase
MCLAALERQTLPAGSFEVIVIDDGSDDDTRQWLGQQQFQFAWQTHTQSNQGAASARNRGIYMAHGKYVLFLDDDMVAERQLVAEHLQLHEQSPDTVVLGPATSLPSYPQPWIAWQQYTLEKVYRAIVDGDLKPTFRQFWSGNCSASKDALLAAGCFNEDFTENEDVELGYRLERNGLAFVFNPRAIAYHHSSRGFASWCAAHAIYGKTDVVILRRSEEQYMYAALRREWRNRHPLTRLLARWASDNGPRYRFVTKFLAALVHLAKLAPNSPLSRVTCAALANVLYWNGVRSTLGDRWHLVAGQV